MKLSFKKNPRETGLSGVAHPNPSTAIKGDKKQVGMIYPPSRWDNDYKWTISLACPKDKTENDPCGFRWMKLKYRFDKEAEAREWLKANWDRIITTYKLHQFED